LNILLIQILRIGDALQMTPIIQGLKDTYPDARISVLTSVIGKQIFEQMSEVEEVFILHKSELTQMSRKTDLESMLSAVRLLQSDLKSVNDTDWDWVINFSFSFPSAILAFLANGRKCSGFYATEDRQFTFKEKWFAYAVSSFVNRQYSTFNWVDINKKIINIDKIPKKPDFKPTPENIIEAKNRLHRHGFNGSPILGIHPGASGSHKRWPIDRFISLAKLMTREHGYKILVIGDESEKELGKDVSNTLGSDALDMTGRTTLSELAAYLSQCSLFICNDSGPMHLASAVGVPIIALFFSTHFVETGPYGPGHIIVHPDIPCFPCQGTARCTTRKCLNHIKPETVEQIIVNHKDLIQNNKRSSLDTKDDPVSVNLSVFDPWNNLEWIPLSNRPAGFNDFMRLIIKASLLSGLDSNDPEDTASHMKASLERFAENNGNLRPELETFTNQMGRLKEDFRLGHQLSDKIDSTLTSKPPDMNTIQRLGHKLQENEEKIMSLGKTPYLSPLVEYFRIRLENIHEREITKLSKITADTYKEMIKLASVSKNLSRNILSQKYS